jgi:hypothetical protein
MSNSGGLFYFADSPSDFCVTRGIYSTIEMAIHKTR